MATEIGPTLPQASCKAFSSCEGTSTKPYIHIYIDRYNDCSDSHRRRKLTVSVAPTVPGLNRQLAVRVSYG